MRTAGIDIGSRTIKLVVVERKAIIHSLISDATHDPLDQCKKLMAQTSFDRILATGYGRHFFETEVGGSTITEIKAFARGARALFPGCRTVLDIGGQDTKAIALDERGNVSKFEMNDRCAAGTGMFLEIIAKTLGYDLEEFGKEALKAQGNVQINSMCTVFAQSEVTSLLARRQKREDIAPGYSHGHFKPNSFSFEKGFYETRYCLCRGCCKEPLYQAPLGRRTWVRGKGARRSSDSRGLWSGNHRRRLR